MFRFRSLNLYLIRIWEFDLEVFVDIIKARIERRLCSIRVGFKFNESVFIRESKVEDIEGKVV